MLKKRTLRWMFITAGASLLAGGLAWAEIRECVDCYPCGTSSGGGDVMCCTASAC